MSVVSQILLPHSSLALNANEPVCGGAVWMSGVPSACKKVLSGRQAAGWLAAADAARRWSLYETGCELVTFLAMSVSWSCHIWSKSLPRGGSIYQRFHTAPHVHWAALKLSSKRSLFISYVLRRSASSWKVAVLCMHHCLTAPSRWSGHPTGIRESSSKPSPFCSMTDPSNGTSMVALRLMCDLLHCHVSAANSPRAATTSRAAKRSGSSRLPSIYISYLFIYNK